MTRPTHPCRVDLEDNRYWHPSWAGLTVHRADGSVIEDCFMADEWRQEWKAYERGPDGKLVYTMVGGKPAVCWSLFKGVVRIEFPWEKEPLDARLRGALPEAVRREMRA